MNENENVVEFVQVEGQGNPEGLESITTTNVPEGTPFTVLQMDNDNPIVPLESELTATENDPISVASGDMDVQANLKRALGLLNVKDQLTKIAAFRNKVKEEEGSVVENEDDMAHLDELVRQYTEEQIKHLSIEDLDAIYTSTITGERIELNNITPTKEYEFKRDFLLYKKNSQDYMDKIDEEQKKFEEEYASSEEEMKTLLAQFEDLNLVLRDKMVEVYEKSEDPLIKKKYMIALDAFDNAFTLQTLFDNYSGLRKQNQIYDYKTRGKQIYNKFLKKIAILNLRTDLSMFEMFEIKFLDKKFHHYTDFFLFLVFKHVLHRRVPISREWEATFLTQLTINLKRLYDGKMKPEDKVAFLANVTKVLDLFEGYYTIDKNYNEEDLTMNEEEVVNAVEEIAEVETAIEVLEEVEAVLVDEACNCDEAAPVVDDTAVVDASEEVPVEAAEEVAPAAE